MRRRNQLQVNTFPFLAVLLCAMGALILVLLVMDRKAKLAAVAKAQEKARQQQREYAGRTAARRREADAKRKTTVAAWEKRRDDLRARVTAEKQQLDDEMQRVEARLADAAARLRREEDVVQKLRTQVTAEKARLQQHEQAVADAKREADGLAGKAAEAESGKARLTAELEQLEKALAQLREARKRDAETYSVVPYRGKQGDSRRPLYVECAAGGLIFHPDRQVVDAEMPAIVRQEVERRVTVQREELAKQGVSQARAYLMLLVRPDGIVRRYQLESAIRGMGVDFGYELVDADWKLHFPPAEETRTASVGKPSPEPPAPVAKKTAPSGPVSLMPPATGGQPSGQSSAGPLTLGPIQGGTPGGSPALAGNAGPNLGSGQPSAGPLALGPIQGGTPGGGPALAGNAGPNLGGPGLPGPAGIGGSDGPQIGMNLPPPSGSPGGSGTGTPGAGIGLPTAQPSPEPPAAAGTGSRSAPAIGLSRPRPYGAPADGVALPGIGGATGAAQPSHPDAPVPPLGATNATAATPSAATSATATAGPKAADSGIGVPPLLPNTGTAGSGTGNSAPSRLASGGQAGEAAGNAGEGSGGRPGFQGPTPAPGGPERREIPLRPARITNPGDMTIFVECRADCVVVFPTRKMYALSLLNQTPLYNPLYQTVRDLMRRHLATERPDGSTPRVLIRFLVHPDAERTYHLAYPALETVSVPKTRSSLLPDDDVGHIVSGY